MLSVIIPLLIAAAVAAAVAKAAAAAKEGIDMSREGGANAAGGITPTGALPGFSGAKPGPTGSVPTDMTGMTNPNAFGNPMPPPASWGMNPFRGMIDEAAPSNFAEPMQLQQDLSPVGNMAPGPFMSQQPTLLDQQQVQQMNPFGSGEIDQFGDKRYPWETI